MDNQRDDQVSRRYRELGAVEPRPELDRAILAAAREASQRPRAPLVAPGGRQRWYYSLAAAAVVIFAVAITVHVEREPPDDETLMSPGPARADAPAPVEGEKKESSVPAAPAARTARDAAPERRSAARAERAPAPPAAQALPSFAPEPPPAPAARSEADTLAAQRAEGARLAEKKPEAADALGRRPLEERPQARGAAPAPAPSAAPAIAARSIGAPETPERWLERIVELRSRGRHAEADKALADFRRAYPNYKIAETMRERVEGHDAGSEK